MEPAVREFFKRISYSICIGFTWLTINAVAALKNDNAFIVGSVRLANILFYAWFIISVVILIKLLKKVWNRNFEEERLKDG